MFRKIRQISTEAIYIAVLAAIGLFVIGYAMRTGLYSKLEGVPFAGSLATGAKSIVFSVVNP